jgi:hypothetical protein
LYALAAWIPLLIHFALNDRDALLLSFVLTPALAALMIIAMRSRQLVLSLFMGFALLSHAVAPPFFFMRRQFYTYGGDFGAVKDFQFGVGEFLGIYKWVWIFLAATVAFTLMLSRLMRTPFDQTHGSVELPAGLSDRVRNRYGLWLAIFILGVALPISLFMYAARVGITGLEPTVLPYRLTGVLTYFRMFAVPVIIFAGYAVSRRTRTLAAVILFYAFIAGFASASRYVVMTTAAPLALFPLMERRLIRFAGVALMTAVIFVLVTASRDYVYTRQMPLLQLIGTTVEGYKASTFSPFEIVGGIANRLWGPQDIILAYQYHVPDRLEAIRRYFSSQIVVEDLGQQFYGMTFSGESAAFGVGIGYVPWMIVLADRSLPVLLFLALVTAGLFTVSQWVVNTYRVSPLRLWGSASQPLAFFLVYTIYTSSLNWWTDAMVLAGLGLVLKWMYLRRAPAARRAPGLTMPSR